MDDKKSRPREIVDTAARLFAQKGYDGVSVRDICSSLGVNCSIISYYFGGKRGLYLAVLKDQFGRAARALEAAEANLPPKEALAAVIEALGRFQRSNPLFSALAAREKGTPSPEFVEAGRDYEANYRRRLESIILSGQRQGDFKTGFKAQTVALAINSLLSGAPLGRDGDWGDYLETVIMLLEGLSAPTAEGGVPPIGKQSAKPRNTFGR